MEFGDGSDENLLDTYIFDCGTLSNILKGIQWQIDGAYIQRSKGINPTVPVFSSNAVQAHEDNIFHK